MLVDKVGIANGNLKLDALRSNDNGGDNGLMRHFKRGIDIVRSTVKNEFDIALTGSAKFDLAQALSKTIYDFVKRMSEGTLSEFQTQGAEIIDRCNGDYWSLKGQFRPLGRFFLNVNDLEVAVRKGFNLMFNFA